MKRMALSDGADMLEYAHEQMPSAGEENAPGQVYRSRGPRVKLHGGRLADAARNLDALRARCEVSELTPTVSEGANPRIRSELMIAVTRLIESRRLTQEQAAELFGVTQPRVSDVVRGHIDKFTIDALVKMAAKGRTGGGLQRFRPCRCQTGEID